MAYDYREAYRNDLARIERGIVEMSEKVKREWKMRQYCFAYANFKTFMPELIADKNGEDVFIEMLKVRARTPLDQRYLERIDELELSGDYEDVVKKQNGPFIFCSYHLGSYRKVVLFLASLGYDFTLLVDQGVYDNQKAETEGLVAAANARYGVKSDFQVLNAEEFGSAMTLVKHIREGKSILAYIDGNRGSGGTPKDESQVLKIGFMQREIYVRQGLAYISHITGCPIAPVISYRKTLDDITLHFYPRIAPDATQGKKVYCLQTTEKLYQYLETHLKQYPMQWEGWLYIHKYLDTSTMKGDEGALQPELPADIHWKFNDKRFGLFEFGGEWHLFDFDSYRTYIIPEMVFRWFEKVIAAGGLDNNSPQKSQAAEWFDQLLEQQVLIAA